MKNILLLSLLAVFFVGCASVKEKVAEKADDNQKVLVDCADKGTDSVKYSECQDAAKKEGVKVKEMMK